jgi:hypothetical protein
MSFLSLFVHNDLNLLQTHTSLIMAIYLMGFSARVKWPKREAESSLQTLVWVCERGDLLSHLHI